MIIAIKKMSEQLSDDARVVLALIRDFPGYTNIEIAKRLAFDTDRARNAIEQLLLRNLIACHVRRIGTIASVGEIVIIDAYYPA